MAAGHEPRSRGSFEANVAIVTGAGGGIGRGVAAALAGFGARVAYLDISEELLADVRATDTQLPLTADVSDPDSIGAAVAAVADRWGSVDVLVNSAGVSTPHVATELSASDWRRLIDVNLSGTFFANMAVYPHMRAQRYGRIVNVASVAGKRISFNGNAAYTASKAGVIGLTRHLAYEFARDGITVNAICPGATLTPMMRQLADDDVLAARTKSVPIGRLNEIDDYVAAIRYLASPEASAVCGIALDIDGGSLLGWTDLDSYYARRADLTARYEGARR